MSNATKANQKTISILGCGWYGLELAKALIKANYHVKGSSTTPEKLPLLFSENIEPFLIDIQKDTEKYDAAFFETELLLICIPPRRNTIEHSDFYKKIERIINLVEHHKIKQLIFISSTAVYGNTDSELTELNTPIPETASGSSMLKVESLLKNRSSFTTTIIRFAGLVGPGRHPGRFFAGKSNIPNGDAPINLIHLDDCVGISMKILKDELFGFTYNACAPDHPGKGEFYTLAAVQASLTPPVFKKELLEWKIISTIHTSRLNYKYLVTNWIEWIQKDNSN